jgi:hypothetical protein
VIASSFIASFRMVRKERVLMSYSDCGIGERLRALHVAISLLVSAVARLPILQVLLQLHICGVLIGSLFQHR